MKLNHVNLTVTAVQVAGTFLEQYFDLELLGVDETMAFLSDEDEFVLTLMEDATPAELEYPEPFHIGFFVERKALVVDTDGRLEEDGFESLP